MITAFERDGQTYDARPAGREVCNGCAFIYDGPDTAGCMESPECATVVPDGTVRHIIWVKREAHD